MKALPRVPTLRVLSALMLACTGSGVVIAQTTDSSGGEAFERLTVIGTRPAALTGGSANYLTTEQLEQFRHTDVHRVLKQVPGLYVVEEDGYGLRPNIGLRGSGTDRNSRVTVTEDGVLIAPAPYAAPAAYYFPTMQRMSAVEVRKGSAAVGSSDGVRLAVNIGAMLVAFVALIALFNGLVGGLASLVGIEGLTLQKILGWVFAPMMYLLSIPWTEAQAAGALFGEKLILSEFVAFSHMPEYLAGMSERTRAIVTFSLCGFANLSSIAILLGGLGSLVPEKKELIARFGIKAVAAGSLSNLMSAAMAGILLGI
jgi:hypothetical protein